MDLFYWLALGGGFGAIALCFIWIGKLLKQNETDRVKMRADNERQRADNAEKVAEIFSQPAGDKPDIIKRL